MRSTMTQAPLTRAAVRGTQTFSRAITLLRAVALRPKQGWRLTDLADHCGFDKGSAHRLLAGLVAERLLLQRVGDKHYVPGPLLFELGLGVTQLSGLVARSAPVLARLAAGSKGVAFLYLRSGAEFVCAERVGPSTLKGMSVEVGTRRPLVVSAGGVAILLALPGDEQRLITAANLQQIESFGPARRSAVQKMLRRSRRAGFGLNLADVVPGIHAIGVPLFNGEGQADASLCVVCAAQDLSDERIEALVERMRKEARVLAPEAVPAIG